MFEKILKRRRALAFFAVTYAVFGSAFIFLLFFTPGLEFEQDFSTGELKIFLKNNSAHVIRDIVVETASGKKLTSIKRLYPGEMASVPIGTLRESETLLAKAPFHALAIYAFFFSRKGGEHEVMLFQRLTMPKVAFIDLNFAMELELCNHGNKPLSGSVEERHSQLFFKEENNFGVFSLEVGECRLLAFTLTPKRRGVTKIYFKVRALSSIKEIEREIRIGSEHG